MRARAYEAEDGTPTATYVFLRIPESVPEARRFVTGIVTQWQMQNLADTAELVTSELASNVVQHARCGAFRVTLQRLADDRVRIAVIDRSTTLPVLHAAGHDEDHGRGLAIVDAVAQKWGTDLLRWGKRVWAELEMPPQAEPPAPQVPMYDSHRAQVVYVLILLTVAVLVISGLAAHR